MANQSARVLVETTSMQPRRPERRNGFEMLATALGRALTHDVGAGSLREAFEDALRKTLPLRAIHLRRARLMAQQARGGTDSLVFDVPGPDVHSHGQLECIVEPAGGRGVG